MISASSMMQWLYYGLSCWSTKCLPYEKLSCSIVSVPALPPQTETFSQRKFPGFRLPGRVRTSKSRNFAKRGKPLPAKVSVTDLLPKFFMEKRKSIYPRRNFHRKLRRLPGGAGPAFHQFMEFRPWIVVESRFS